MDMHRIECEELKRLLRLVCSNRADLIRLHGTEGILIATAFGDDFFMEGKISFNGRIDVSLPPERIRVIIKATPTDGDMYIGVENGRMLVDIEAAPGLWPRKLFLFRAEEWTPQRPVQPSRSEFLERIRMKRDRPAKAEALAGSE
ncbi:MAG: hypothetical protein ACYCTW_09155 [Sulfuricella sp.]